MHLIVLVHGFQGNHSDMRQLRNHLLTHAPESLILLSQANEGSEHTEGDIMLMGTRLAAEVKQYCEQFSEANMIAKVSFIGHSLGGLIIRAAISQLGDLQAKLHTYMSMSSPHLGYMYNSNKLLDAGMWVMKNWKKS